MLLHLFEMQDRNSAWTSLCFKHHLEDARNPRNSIPTLQHYNPRSSLHCNNSLRPHGTLGYSQKHPELDSSPGKQNFPERQESSFVSRLCQSQPICNGMTSSRLSNICQPETVGLLACSQTKSEPVTRSNSVDCEREFPNLLLKNATRTSELDTSGLSDLTIPNG